MSSGEKIKFRNMKQLSLATGKFSLKFNCSQPCMCFQYQFEINTHARAYFNWDKYNVWKNQCNTIALELGATERGINYRLFSYAELCCCAIERAAFEEDKNLQSRPYLAQCYASVSTEMTDTLCALSGCFHAVPTNTLLSGLESRCRVVWICLELFVHVC